MSEQEQQTEKVYIVGQGQVEKDPVTQAEKLIVSPKVKKGIIADDPFKSSNEIKRTFYVKTVENTQPSILDIRVRQGRYVSKLPKVTEEDPRKSVSQMSLQAGRPTKSRNSKALQSQSPQKKTTFRKSTESAKSLKTVQHKNPKAPKAESRYISMENGNLGSVHHASDHEYVDVRGSGKSYQIQTELDYHIRGPLHARNNPNVQTDMQIHRKSIALDIVSTKKSSPIRNDAETILQSPNSNIQIFQQYQPSNISVSKQSQLEKPQFSIKISKPDHLISQVNPITHTVSAKKIEKKQFVSIKPVVEKVQNQNPNSSQKQIYIIKSQKDVDNEMMRIRSEQLNQYQSFAQKINAFRIQAQQIKNETSNLSQMILQQNLNEIRQKSQIQFQEQLKLKSLRIINDQFREIDQKSKELLTFDRIKGINYYENKLQERNQIKSVFTNRVDIMSTGQLTQKSQNTSNMISPDVKKYDYFGKYKNSEQVSYKNKLSLIQPYTEPSVVDQPEEPENQDVLNEINEIQAINERVENQINSHVSKTREREDYEKHFQSKYHLPNLDNSLYIPPKQIHSFPSKFKRLPVLL